MYVCTIVRRKQFRASPAWLADSGAEQQAPTVHARQIPPSPPQAALCWVWPATAGLGEIIGWCCVRPCLTTALDYCSAAPPGIQYGTCARLCGMGLRYYSAWLLLVCVAACPGTIQACRFRLKAMSLVL